MKPNLLQQLSKKIEHQNHLIKRIQSVVTSTLYGEEGKTIHIFLKNFQNSSSSIIGKLFFAEVLQNTTIEERVALLEIQVVEIEQDVADLDQDVNFLFDQQVIQEERILTLEQNNDVIDDELESGCHVQQYFMKITSSLK